MNFIIVQTLRTLTEDMETQSKHFVTRNQVNGKGNDNGGHERQKRAFVRHTENNSMAKVFFVSY